MENKRLCKSRNDLIIAGVCGGIAEHFNWDSNVVRLVFIFCGVGILAYIIAAVVMPDSPYL